MATLAKWEKVASLDVFDWYEWHFERNNSTPNIFPPRPIVSMPSTSVNNSKQDKATQAPEPINTLSIQENSN